jgi:hypothetical protein
MMPESNSQNNRSQNVPIYSRDGYEEFSDGSSRMRDFSTPPQSTFDSEEMIGSIQRILEQNRGSYVVIEFLIGTAQLMRKQGILYFIGNNYVTLYDDQVQNFIVCDLFSIKFVYFYIPGRRPNRNFNLLPNASR